MEQLVEHFCPFNSRNLHLTAFVSIGRIPQEIPRRFFRFLGCPDNHLVVIPEGFEPGLDVGGGVLEGLIGSVVQVYLFLAESPKFS